MELWSAEASAERLSRDERKPSNTHPYFSWYTYNQTWPQTFRFELSSLGPASESDLLSAHDGVWGGVGGWGYLFTTGSRRLTASVLDRISQNPFSKSPLASPLRSTPWRRRTASNHTNHLTLFLAHRPGRVRSPPVFGRRRRPAQYKRIVSRWARSDLLPRMPYHPGEKSPLTAWMAGPVPLTSTSPQPRDSSQACLQ